MRTLLYQPPGTIKNTEADIPSISLGEALIKVHLSGICGTDMGIVHGAHPRVKTELVPGHEFVGEIIELCPEAGLKELKTGDRVVVFPLIFCGKCRACQDGFSHVCSSLRLIGIDCAGGFADYAVVPIKHIIKLPDDIDYSKGVLVEPLAVTVHAAEIGCPSQDDCAVVIGAGPIGLLQAFTLQQLGINKVLVTDINPFRLERARRMGFDTCNANQSIEQVNKITGNEGADIVFECAGSPSVGEILFELLRPRGKVVMVSVHKTPCPLDLRSLNFKEITIAGARVYTIQNYYEAMRILPDLPAEEIVSHVVSMENGKKAFEILEDSQTDSCKVVINMEDTIK